MDQESDIEDIICIENKKLFHIFDKEIKCENDTNIEVKVERLYFDNNDTDLFETESLENYDIYKDHTIKEELVIGPEIIQETYVEHTEDKKPCGTVAKQSKSKSSTVYDCQQCTKSFPSNQARSRHYKTAHPSHTCKTCGKTFNKISNLNRHLNYVCPKNEYTTQNNKVKKYGMYSHPFICDICKKTYTHKNTLVTHLKKHLGVGMMTLYKCHICDKTYTKKHNLKCHITSKHSKLNLYSCKKCKREFGWQWSLSCHERLKHCKNKV